MDTGPVARLPLAQFRVRHWFQLIALLALIFAGVHYLGPATLIGAPLLLSAFFYVNWRGFVATFVDAILAVYTIAFITIAIAFVLWFA